MGFDIKIARYDVDKCPHCGMPIKGTRIDWTESGGPVWRDFLKEVGYYVPYEQRKIEPEREWYGKDMVLTTKQEVDEIPTIDQESLRPTAHWIVTKTNVCGINRYECSSCGAVRYKASALHLNYCQDCGKRMVNADESL